MKPKKTAKTTPSRREEVLTDFATLRIPVTADQKAKIMEAVSLDGGDMAAWARPILIREAEKRLRE